MKTVYESGSVEQIVSAMTQKLKDCTFIMYGADDSRFEEISSKLHKALPDAKMIGTTGYLLSADSGMSQGIVAIGFLDSEVEVYVGTLRKVDTYPIKYLPGLIWSSDMITKKYKNNLCIEFTTGCEEKVVSTMKVCLEKVGMRLIGATAGNTAEGQQKKVSCNGKVLTNSAVFATIGSKIGKIEIYKENLFHTRKKSHTVTKVSDDERTILEIDDRKAMDVYEEDNNYTDTTVSEGIFFNPLCRVVGAQHYITGIRSFNKSDRSISVYKNIQKNDLISFTDIDSDFKQFIKDNLNDISSKNNIAGIFSINCILRYRFFEKNNFTGEYAKLFSKAANGCHAGIISDGEQYIEQHINQSMVCAVFTKDR